MGILTSLNNEIWKEKACIEDLTKEFVMHVQENRFELAATKHQDIHKSIKRVQHLHRQKQLYSIAVKFEREARRYAEKV
ncbi:hypothetical protein [Lysinibacillus antri]|uniref:Uncharacterized protein n=1 Tax=Lysinibacillus antri TaxID=2498145 RepID=A0A432LHL9_9BACI|nr:hypothetical protein [Lysinibacillus antri]RUL56493.1 hypothetical protein EK386_02355 [Lysinibacillus antri]